MNGYRNTVTALAKLTNESEVSLVVNLFQSVLDGFIRAEIKRAESEPAKVGFIFSIIIILTTESVNLLLLVQ